MSDCFVEVSEEPSIQIRPILTEHFPSWVAQQNLKQQAWIHANRFEAKSGSVCLVPDERGALSSVLLGVNHTGDFWKAGVLPAKLPAGVFSFDEMAESFSETRHLTQACLAFALGCYQFNAYRKPNQSYEAKLLLPSRVDHAALKNWVKSIYFVRDLINTPLEDMGPEALGHAACELAKTFGAKVNTIVGDALLKKGFQTVHAVGRASTQAPRLIDLRWGKKDAPRLTLVGKGVCFDTGGINLKPTSGMRFMKKDMAGAAHALGLARMVMAQDLPVCLRVLIPAVDNAVSGNSIRPGDVIKTRTGLSVEITNTDAEGRLVLGDALAEAVLEKPDCLIDFATLTGAATVALGPEVPSLFSNNDPLACDLLDASEYTDDPMWQMPLYQPYRRYLKSDVADIVNASDTGYAGSITAALYLQHFVPDDVPWVHFDMFAWNKESSPGRPVGGEAKVLRALFHCLEKRYT